MNASPRVASTLTGILDDRRAPLVRRLDAMFDYLIKVSAGLNTAEQTKDLEEQRRHLLSDRFEVIVVGRFKNGKSTLMNALLGRADSSESSLPVGQGPMPVGTLPTTATLTKIHYSPQPYVRAKRFDGTIEDWSFEKYLRESTLVDDEDENEKMFGAIREFEVGYPAELCRSGVTLMDSPGLSDVPLRTETTRAAVASADAAIVVYSTNALAGEDERSFVREQVAGTHTHQLTVINRFPGFELSRRELGFTWNRLVNLEKNGPKYAGQDLTSEDIFFVDARQGAQGKLGGDPSKIVDSGLAAFEQRLADFLLRDRLFAHLEKSINHADVAATTVDRQLANRLAALQVDTATLLEEYAKIQPQLQAIREQREVLPATFERFRREAQRQLKASFVELVARIRKELPGRLTAYHLPSWKEGIEGMLNVTQTRKLAKEAADYCNDYLSHELRAWQEGPAQEELGRLLDRLLEDVQDEMVRIDRSFQAIYVQLTGVDVQPVEQVELVSKNEKIISGVVGTILAGPGMLVGVQGGYRSMAGSVAASVGAGVLVAVLGLSGLLLPIAIIASIGGALVGGGHRLQERTKERVLQTVLPRLKDAELTAQQEIDKRIDEQFEVLTAGVMQAILSKNETEERNIDESVRLNQAGRVEKEAATTAYEQRRDELKQLQSDLRELAVEARQSL